MFRFCKILQSVKSFKKLNVKTGPKSRNTRLGTVLHLLWPRVELNKMGRRKIIDQK